MLDEDASSEYVGLNMVRWKNVISKQPFEECDFIFTSMYREITKLCIPTLGILRQEDPLAGDGIPRTESWQLSGVCAVQRIKSSSSDSFDVVVDELLNRKLGPAATQTGRIPSPLVFNFMDRDRMGISDILVNIFDYSGMIRNQTLQDRQRQRALDGDGFFFFLIRQNPAKRNRKR